jgi:hypothetical protein
MTETTGQTESTKSEITRKHALPLMRKPLGAMVASFKSSTVRRINGESGETGIRQRNYYECVVRNDKEWDTIRRYIESNPDNWEEDEENPGRVLEEGEQGKNNMWRGLTSMKTWRPAVMHMEADGIPATDRGFFCYGA